MKRQTHKSFLKILVVVVIALLAGFKLSAEAGPDPSARNVVRMTTEFIDANVSLDYPGFAGLSLDSLGKEHFPLVAMNLPPKPWLPTRAEVRGSRIEYRRPAAESRVDSAQ